MNENLCKKCGCVVFSQDSEYCDACKPKEENKELKKKLLVDNSASKNLSTINTTLLILGYISLVVGSACFFIGLSSIYGAVLIVSGITTFLFGLLVFIYRIFVSSIIAITKSAEYYYAQIEEKFEIEEKLFY